MHSTSFFFFFFMPIVMQVSPAEYLGCFIDDPSERILSLAYNASDAMTPTVSALVLPRGGSAMRRQRAVRYFCRPLFGLRGSFEERLEKDRTSIVNEWLVLRTSEQPTFVIHTKFL